AHLDEEQLAAGAGTSNAGNGRRAGRRCGELNRTIVAIRCGQHDAQVTRYGATVLARTGEESEAAQYQHPPARFHRPSCTGAVGGVALVLFTQARKSPMS